ncbi:NADP-dependent oxidoreductase domain-containing protein [Schizophyllum commune]
MLSLLRYIRSFFGPSAELKPALAPIRLLGKDVGRVGYGMMSLSWREVPPPTDEAIQVLKAALEAGATFWNGGELYGTPEYNSLHLLRAYFTKYPEDADRVVLSIKAGFPNIDGSPATVIANAVRCAKVLEGVKKIDIFECARKDPNVDIEQTVGALAQLVTAGVIGGIGLSEVGAETIRRAANVHPIAAVEVECSLWAVDILNNGVAAACSELNIPIVAYCPLGRGFLTGQYKKIEDLPENLRDFPRFQPGLFEQNIRLVNEVDALAKRKGCKTGQVAISWVASLNGRPGMPPILPLPGASAPERAAENTKLIDLTEKELKELDDIVKRCTVVGDRYGGPGAALMWG